jgi:hypothetical protein
MVAPFIALQYQSTPQMIRYAATNATGVGNTFGTADGSISSATLNPLMPVGRVIRFGGLNTYVAAVGDSIYRTTNGGTTWTSVLTIPSIGTDNNRKSGFAVIYLNGRPAIVMIYSESASTTALRAVYSFDGVTWTTQGPFTALSVSAGADLGFNQMVVSGSTLFCSTLSSAGNAPQIVIYDPGSNSAVGVAPTGASASSSQVGPSLCEFNNRIFFLYMQSAGTTLALAEIVGQTTTVISSLDTLTATTAFGAAALFVDGTSMYAIAIGSTSGLKCWEISSALTVTNISTTVLPTVLTSTLPVDSGGHRSTRVLPVIDGVTSPGSSPTIYLYISITANGPWALYQWNGGATQISMISQGGSSLHSLPFFKNVTGTYFVADSVFPSTAGISTEITDRTFTASGIRLSFKIYGTSAGGDASFRVYVGGSTAEYPTTAATLSSPSVGTISGSTINIGLTADNGATTYQVTWDAQTDGFTTNTEFRLIGDAFI